jgi:hypothetical protein
LITIAFSITFTLKRRLFARRERFAKGNKTTTILLWSQGRAISADIGREIRLVWCKCVVGLCYIILLFNTTFELFVAFTKLNNNFGLYADCMHPGNLLALTLLKKITIQAQSDCW